MTVRVQEQRAVGYHDAHDHAEHGAPAARAGPHAEHGGPFTVVARDGIVLAPAARFEADVINVGPGQRYDVIWPAREPGKWIFHCHIPHHTLNNNVEQQGGGGLTMVVDVTS